MLKAPAIEIQGQPHLEGHQPLVNHWLVPASGAKTQGEVKIVGEKAWWKSDARRKGKKVWQKKEDRKIKEGQRKTSEGLRRTSEEKSKRSSPLMTPRSRSTDSYACWMTSDFQSTPR